MVHLLKQLYFILLACLVHGKLEPYFKELLKIVAKKQMIASEELEMDACDKDDNVTEEHTESNEEREEDIVKLSTTIPRDTTYLAKLTAKDKKRIIKSHIKDAYFCPMPFSKQFHANKKTVDDFPWIARVYHSPGQELPICTAAAIKICIFVTAARCLATSKVGYTYVHYRKKKFRPIAFVMPETPSKQMFDDIGFIVVDSQPQFTWKPIEVFGGKRKGEGYFWLEEYKVNTPTNKIVGFVETYDKDELYSLEELYVNNDLCHQLVRIDKSTDAYHVPCAHPCTPQDQEKELPGCDRYLAGLGHAVVMQQPTELLLGVVTWTCENDKYVSKHRLPMGIAVANSNAFHNGLRCSLFITVSRFTTNNTTFKKMCGKDDVNWPHIKDY